MVNMILKVPVGFDAKAFMHFVTLILNGQDKNFGMEFDLGELLSGSPLDNLDELGKVNAYEINAEFIDFETIDILKELQKICPEVEFYFEHNDYCNAISDRQAANFGDLKHVKESLRFKTDFDFSTMYFRLFNHKGEKQGDYLFG